MNGEDEKRRRFVLRLFFVDKAHRPSDGLQESAEHV
jgi:hypothetical protein